MSKRIEPCLFRCSVCEALSHAGESTVTFLSAGCLRLMLPTGWKAVSMPFVGDRQLVDFVCPRCAKEGKTHDQTIRLSDVADLMP
jgi:hypothetical protein